jgi:hypothetical protein
MQAHIMFRRGNCVVAGLVAVMLVGLVWHARGADHRDGPRITDVNAGLAALDLNDLFVFRSPVNAKNTVLILTVSPFAGVLTPTPLITAFATKSPSIRTSMKHPITHCARRSIRRGKRDSR